MLIDISFRRIHFWNHFFLVLFFFKFVFSLILCRITGCVLVVFCCCFGHLLAQSLKRIGIALGAFPLIVRVSHPKSKSICVIFLVCSYSVSCASYILTVSFRDFFHRNRIILLQSFSTIAMIHTRISIGIDGRLIRFFD